MEELLKRLGLSVARGVPQMASGFVDLAALPFTATGLLKPEQAVGSTDWMTARGYLPPKQEGLLSESAEMASSMLSPTGATKAGLLALGMAATKGKGGKALNSILKTQYDEAMEVAQKNAALPVSEGGLGLPPDNTAMDRAKAMGFDIDLYHGTDKDITQFLKDKPIEKDQGWYGNKGVYLTPDTDTASAYAGYHEKGVGENVMPLIVRRGKVFDYGDAAPLKTAEESAQFSRQMQELGYDTIEVPNKYAAPEFQRNYETVVLDPKNIRSRFAAFDPKRIDENNLLASLLASLGVGGLLYTPDEEEQY